MGSYCIHLVYWWLICLFFLARQLYLNTPNYCSRLLALSLYWYFHTCKVKWVHFERLVFIHTPQTYAVACIILGRVAFLVQHSVWHLTAYGTVSIFWTGGCLVLACWGAWRWTESLVLRWLCRAALNAASHLVWLSFRVLWVQALDSSWCFPLYCVGKLIKASFFTAEGVIVEAARLPASWLTHPPFNGADVIHIQLQSWHDNQDACRLFTSKWREKTHFFLERKNSFQEILRSPKQGGVRVWNNMKNLLQNESLDDCVAIVMQWCCCYINTCFIEVNSLRFSYQTVVQGVHIDLLKHTSNYYCSRTRLLEAFLSLHHLKYLAWHDFLSLVWIQVTVHGTAVCVLWLWHYHFLKHFFIFIFLDKPLAFISLVWLADSLMSLFWLALHYIQGKLTQRVLQRSVFFFLCFVILNFSPSSFIFLLECIIIFNVDICTGF